MRSKFPIIADALGLAIVLVCSFFFMATVFSVFSISGIARLA
jgi:hypothetical protein